MMKRVLAGLLILVLVVVCAAYLMLRSSLPMLDGSARVSALGALVAVERDALGVITITGSSREDVATATGFAHAQDRFFQMDLMRRQAAGELAALFGPAALPADRSHRLHRMRAVAREALGFMSDRHRNLLKAYAAGVNARIAELGSRPPEYWLVGSAPQAWRPEDSVLVIHAMHFLLTDGVAAVDARRAKLLQCLPPATARFLMSNDGHYAAPIDGGALPEDPMPTADVLDLRNASVRETTPRRDFEASMLADPNFDVPSGNSNSWAVSGARTRTGIALVANDMHLPLRLPNVWYRARFVVTDPEQALNISGASLPGAPAMVVGSNGLVAWGFTNSYGDWSDRIALETVPDRPGHYLTSAGEQAFETIRETIEVKGGDSETLVVQKSLWGPVVSDSDGGKHAVQWLAHHPQASNIALMDMEQAKDVYDALSVAARSGVPPQNIVIGDTQGNIAWSIAGLIPARDPNLDDTRSSTARPWSGWLDPADYPSVINPPGGQIWTANNQIVTGAQLRALGDSGYWHGARARQIRDGLTALETATPADMLDIALDDRAMLMQRWHRLMVEVVAGADGRHPRMGELATLLDGWNGRASVDAAAYRLVRAFRARVRDIVLDAITAPCHIEDPNFRFVEFRQHEGPLWRVVSARPAHLLPPGHQSWEQLLSGVVVEALEFFSARFDGPLGDRTWGEYNTARIGHPISLAVPALAPLLDIEPEALPGDYYVPRAQTPDVGASERFAVSPGHEEEGYFHMPGGQSGHPLSPYYRRGHRAWAEGRPTPFLPGPAKHRLELSP